MHETITHSDSKSGLFFQFLSDTKLFSLDYEGNDPLIDAIDTIFVEDIVKYEAQVNDNSAYLEFTNYCKAFFEDFCRFSNIILDFLRDTYGLFKCFML